MNPEQHPALVRRMTAADVDRVIEIAESLSDAPAWARSAYLAALNPQGSPPRIALVAEDASGAKAPADSVGIPRGLKAPPPSEPRFPEVYTQCECDGVVGFAVASLLAPEAELESIAVAAGFQRRGIARQLLAALTAELRAAKVTRVTEVILEARASNQPALALYREFGFVVSGLRTRYYQIPVDDAVLMRLRL